MKKCSFFSAGMLAALFFISSAHAFDVPDTHLKNNEAKDAALIIPNENTDQETSPLEIFVDTLLGKNIDKVPEKSKAE